MSQINGRLRHCWWGEYHATIGLFCKDKSEAANVLKALGEPWKAHKESDTVVIYHGKKPGLNNVLDKLESLGANRDKMTSIAKSIDFGEEFSVFVNTNDKE